MRDRPVEVLDRIGRAQRAVQRACDPQLLHRQRFLQPFAQAVRRARMLGMKRRRQPRELLLGQLGLGTVPGVAHGAADAGVQLLGQMLDHVAPLVLLAALDERESSEAIDDGLAQRLASIDHPQPHTIRVESALHQIAEQRAHDPGALCGASITGGNHWLRRVPRPATTIHRICIRRGSGTPY